MQDKLVRGVDAWVDVISAAEIPALTSTVQRFDSMSHDETSSLAAIGQSILHDHALTSKVLRVANATRMGKNKVTTISRATVILGVETVKSICITAKLITSLLKNKNLSASVYQRLLTLMALSFQSAMLAKMMASKYDEETQEEIFIASLLHHLAETAFWSLGGEITDRLDEKLRSQPNNAEEIVQQMLGTSFNDISAGLAKTWHYGEFLKKSFDQPNQRTKEMQIVALANDISMTLYKPERAQIPMSQLVKRCADIMGINELQTQNKIKQCTQNTVKQLQSYGAQALTKYIKTDVKEALQYEMSDELEIEQDKTSLQFEILKEIAMLALEKVDFNQIIHTAMEGISRGVGFERTVVMVFDGEKKRLSPRFITAKNVDSIKAKFVVNFADNEHAFIKALKTKEPALYTANNGFNGLVSKAGFCVAPLVVSSRCIGLVFGDFYDNNLPVSQQEYASFCHFVIQTNLALSLLSQR